MIWSPTIMHYPLWTRSHLLKCQVGKLYCHHNFFLVFSIHLFNCTKTSDIFYCQTYVFQPFFLLFLLSNLYLLACLSPMMICSQIFWNEGQILLSLGVPHCPLFGQGLEQELMWPFQTTFLLKNWDDNRGPVSMFKFYF